MTKWRACALALCAALLPFVASAQVPVAGPVTHAFTASGQSFVFACTGGQSSFALTVPSGLTGTWTVTVGQASGTATANPPWSYAPGSATYVNTITNNGTLTVNLGSNSYVKVADTAYTSGSATVTGACSAAVAVIPPSSGGGGGVTSVSATGPLASSGGATPVISITAAPSFGGPVAATSSGSTSSYVPPLYTIAGAAIASTAHEVKASGSCSSSSATAGPFTGYTATVSLTNAAQFSSVSTSATSLEVGGGATLAANNYWLQNFGTFAVEWSTGTTLYVECKGASQIYNFIAEGY